MAVVSMKNLLEAGVHFGHQKRRWDPRMKHYIYTERNDIYIIDLQQTLGLIENAYKYIEELTAKGGIVLFVGTKRQAQKTIREAAEKSSMPYINNRWLGGILTNFKTISSRIDRIKELERMEAEGEFDVLNKKEVLLLNREKAKLLSNLEGIRYMGRLPDALFIVDPKTEEIAVREANRLNIPVVSIVDTNCNPDNIEYCVPGNDDAIRSIALITDAIGRAAESGHAKWAKVAAEEEARKEKEKAEAEVQRAKAAEVQKEKEEKDRQEAAKQKEDELKKEKEPKADKKTAKKDESKEASKTKKPKVAKEKGEKEETTPKKETTKAKTAAKSEATKAPDAKEKVVKTEPEAKDEPKKQEKEEEKKEG
ncbi:MAG TPA: 30S ribosomal protein S2 [Actinobacteria bacterium]|nr:30S ribosomal protein S2 [Actinomycetota bacterium]